MRKGLMIGTLVCLGVCALFLILTIFGISFFEGVKLDILITMATLTVVGYFSLSSYNMLSKNKILAYISFALIIVSALLVVISTWADIGDSGLFFKITVTIALISILFIFIVSTNLKLGHKLVAVQVVCQLILGVFVLLSILLTFGITFWNNTLFFVMLVLSIVAFIAISVLSNKANVDSLGEGYVKITKTEYEELLAKAKQLEELQNQTK